MESAGLGAQQLRRFAALPIMEPEFAGRVKEKFCGNFYDNSMTYGWMNDGILIRRSCAVFFECRKQWFRASSAGPHAARNHFEHAYV